MSTLGDWGSQRDRDELDAWITREDIDDEQYERCEEDATISPCGQLGAGTSASFGHVHLGEFYGEGSEDEALAAIRAEGKRSQFWPNVWRISDHGNEHLIEGFTWEVEQ